MENISKVKNIFIILNSPTSKLGMSGSDKIYIKIGEEILGKNINYSFLTNPDGKKILTNSSHSKFEVHLVNNISVDPQNLVGGYLLRILGSFKILFVKIPKNSVVISSSDFLTDTLVLLLIYLKYGKNNLYFTSMFLRKNLNKRFNFSDLLYKFSQLITIQITKLFHLKIFTNKIDISYLNSKGIDKRNILVLPGGIERVELQEKKKFDACFVGRIHPQKGIQILLKLWKKFVISHPEAMLALICSGSANQTKDLKLQIKRQGLKNNIKFLGFLDNLDKYKVIAGSKMFLFPSSYESFGISLLEALSLKIPAVSFDLEAIRLNFDHGVLISKNEKEFFKNIEKLFRHPSLREELGAAGFKVSLKYTWPKIAAQFLNDLV